MPDKSVESRVLENAKEVREQRKQSRQTKLNNYTTDELIENLKSRKLNKEQALELESMLLSIPSEEK